MTDEERGAYRTEHTYHKALQHWQDRHRTEKSPTEQSEHTKKYSNIDKIETEWRNLQLTGLVCRRSSELTKHDMMSHWLEKAN